ncbi:concanavalin A-like lectin/glucanase [Tothia fuscella]|uniref:Crh-like protein n=1 Tax=Tothia fuscella TaxID=1048955 RepID=A0A9P4NJC3_9PEZI|nr:concanavalin A-like lectin/glucanase [Tothia fuscella]
MVLPIELTALLLAAVVPLIQAQTFTECDPLQKSCPADKAMGGKFTTSFGSGNTIPAGWHSVPCAGKIAYGQGGATAMTIGGKGDCPTIETDDYVLFGLFEVKMKAAPGQGVISSVVMQSDVRDEVDWEFIGGENFRVQSNYFGKADQTTFDRMVYVPIGDPQNQWHTYSVNWTSAAITWLVDGVAVRTLNYNDAKGGTRFPQTPMRLRIGSWVGGDPTLNGKGTVTWAGGEVDYSKAPFNMYIDSVNIVNYSPASQYRYKDNSGSWQSIEIVGGTAGGIVSPSQNFAQQSSVSSSTSGVSTGSTIVPPIAIGTKPASSSPSTNAVSNATGITTSTVAVKTEGVVKTGNSSTVAVVPKPASASSSTSTTAKPAQASTNAAASLGGMREIAGLSIFSAIVVALFC